MTIPADLKYTKSHEWVKPEADGTVLVGITDHAQEALGDIVFLELPELGRNVAAGQECAVVESVKAASDIYAPITGAILAINEDAAGAPESVNTDPYGAWLFRMSVLDPTELDGLLDAAGYEAAASEGH